ncbi:site-specific DNA-methyltransferase [Helicobacter pylori]|nr:site-specific DNA-methyltransferase [Helicobacter pylori]
MQNKEISEEKSVNEKNLEVFNRYFPGCLSIENDNQLTLDVGRLKALLGDFSEIKEEGYGLDFVGKKIALNQAFKKNNKILKPLNESTSKHILIKGDNLDALKILKQSYSEKIKMIYIDPPYNTKNDNFIYGDDFSQSNEEVLKTLDYSKEKLDYIKNLFGSKCHSGWLSFMYPRLLLAKDLLKQDGVIFISIDDNECAQLKLLCDEIFGEGNFVAQFIWHSKNKPSGNTTEDKTIDTRTEYIFCYQKYNFKANKYENTKEELEEKGYILKDKYFETRGHYKLTPLMHSCSASSFQYIESLDYEIQAPDGTWFKNHQNIKKEKSYCYTWSKKLFDFGNQNGFIEFQKTSDGFWCAYRKMYELCAIDNKKLQIIYRKSGNAYSNLITNLYSDIGANEVRNIFSGEKIFSYPKPTKLINRLIELSTNEGDLILDFFAGSGTTAHAVLESNKSDYQKLSEGGGYLMA